jgi:hypothetical protein
MARLLALAAAAALVLSGCGGGSSSTPATVTVHRVVPGHFRCPDPGTAPASVADHGADTLPTGARSARLCLLDNNIAWIPPRGILTTGLDRLVGVVNAQHVHDPASDLGCGGVGAPAWSIVLRYAGGTRTITGDNGGCWDLRVGASERFGSRTVYGAYLREVLRQRHQQGSPDVVWPPPRCPQDVRTDEAFSPVADAGRLTSAVLCPADGGQSADEIALTRAQVDVLRHDFATAFPRRALRDVDSQCPDEGRQPAGAVIGRDPWGDQVTVLFGCDSYRTVRPGSERYGFARMLPSTALMLLSALEG